MRRSILGYPTACRPLAMVAWLIALPVAIAAADAPHYWASEVAFHGSAQRHASPPEPWPEPEAESESSPAAAPLPAAARGAPAARAHAPRRRAAERRQSGGAHHAVAYAGDRAVRPAFHQMPRRSPIQPNGGQPLAAPSKPFHSAENRPTISPYLNLDRDEGNSESLPNYYAFVRPQLEQQEANTQQQQQMQDLQRKAQRPANDPSGRPAVAGTGQGPARFMDTAQFYRGWQR